VSVFVMSDEEILSHMAFLEKIVPELYTLYPTYEALVN